MCAVTSVSEAVRLPMLEQARQPGVLFHVRSCHRVPRVARRIGREPAS